MKKTVFAALCMAVVVACTTAGQDTLTGTWTVVTRGVDSQNTPCPFVPEEISFFKDGTVIMSNMPPGMKMFYKTSLTGEEAAAIMRKFPYLKDKGHILLMKPAAPEDWLNAMAYDYTVKGDELTLFLPGWTMSTFSRKQSR